MTNSRDKGARFERRIANALKEAFGINLRRTPLSGGWAEDHPDTAGDVVCTDPSVYWPYSIECKNSESWRLESLFTKDHKWFDNWWEQTLDECPEGKIPVLIFTRNYCPMFAVVRCEHALELLLEAQAIHDEVLDIVTLELRNGDIVIFEFGIWVKLEQTLQRGLDDV